MPAYDFRCTRCDDTFEVVRSSQDDSGVVCPECGADAKRVFTPVGVVFKGSGFHNTDYRKKSSDSSDTPAPCGADKPKDSACSNCPAAE